MIGELIDEILFIFRNFYLWLNTSNNLFLFTLNTVFWILISLFLPILQYFQKSRNLAFKIESKKLFSGNLLEIENLKLSYKNKPVSSYNKSVVLLYNNGRLAINKEDVKYIKFKSSNGNILNFDLIKRHDSTKFKIKKNQIQIELDEFDRKDYLVFEVTHEFDLILEGRLRETGKLSNSKEKYFNIIEWMHTIIAFIIIFWSLFQIDENNILTFKWAIIAFIVFFFFHFIVVNIRKIFFVPANLLKKYFDQ